MTIKKHIIILAAGAGTRMRSDKPKVLQEVAGIAMIDYVLQAAEQLEPSQITIVYGYKGEQLKTHLADKKVNWAQQEKQLGTGHAVNQAMPFVADEEVVLVLYGDAPLIQSEDLHSLGAQQAVLTAYLDHPTGYGRIIRNGRYIDSIVEEKDASEQQKQLQEVNSGIIQAPAKLLKKLLHKITPDNAQGEYYLTDVIALAARSGEPFSAIQVAHSEAIEGANDMQQLIRLDRVLQKRYKNKLMQAGVRLKQPESIWIEGELTCGREVVIEPGVILKGRTNLQDGVVIGAYSVIDGCELAAGTHVAAHSMLEGVKTLGNCQIGPYARLRPGTTVGKNCKIGNFVESKKAVFHEGAKASHLSYLGDVEIGKNVNIGAGTITCNYDGVNKYKTVIEEGAFIGSDTQLIAPVRIGKNATIGAGSTINRDAPADKLTLSRGAQKTINDWQRPVKKES